MNESKEKRHVFVPFCLLPFLKMHEKRKSRLRGGDERGILLCVCLSGLGWFSISVFYYIQHTHVNGPACMELNATHEVVMCYLVFYLFFLAVKTSRVSSQVRIDDKSSGNAKQKNLKNLLAPAVVTAGRTVVGVTCRLSGAVNLYRHWI